MVLFELDAMQGLFRSRLEFAATGDGRDVAIDPEDGVVWLAGDHHVSGPPDFGGGPVTTGHSSGQDLFVARLQTNGGHLFSAAYGSPGLEQRPRLAAGPDRTAYLFGQYPQPFAFDDAGVPLAVIQGGGNDLFLVRLRAPR
jgi:hypothetical protein